MYKVIIGLEVHCELKTNSKNFSSAKNTYTNLPNVNVMPVDLGLPGILPVVNKEACRKALKTAMALNCTTPDEIIFDVSVLEGRFIARKGSTFYTHWNADISKNIAPPSRYGRETDNGVFPFNNQMYKFSQYDDIFIATCISGGCRMEKLTLE